MASQKEIINSLDGLLNGAVAIAMHGVPGVQAADVDNALQTHVDTVRARVRGIQPQAMLAHLHGYLFDELGFIGDTEMYYNPANDYLPYVLEHKRGSVLMLSLVYKIVAERLGLVCWGVKVPGHFYMAVGTDNGPMLIDAFAGGRFVTAEEVNGKMQSTFGTEAEWTDELMDPVSTKHWLSLILQQLLNIYGLEGRYTDVAAVLEFEMLLWPDQLRLERDLGLVLARIGMSKPAAAWLARYLMNNPDDPQKKDLEQLLDVLES